MRRTLVTEWLACKSFRVLNDFAAIANSVLPIGTDVLEAS
jgi:hypothetical protein